MSAMAKQPQRHRTGGGSTRQEEPDNIRSLRRLYGRELGTLREMFTDWTDEDLLQVLQETDGQLDTAAMRISTGQASQWGQVKSKKSKKDEYQRSSASHSYSTSGPRGSTASNQLSSGFQASLAAATAHQQTSTPSTTSSHTYNNGGAATTGAGGSTSTNNAYGARYSGSGGSNYSASNHHSQRGGSASGRGRGGFNGRGTRQSHGNSNASYKSHDTNDTSNWNQSHTSDISVDPSDAALPSDVPKPVNPPKQAPATPSKPSWAQIARYLLRRMHLEQRNNAICA
ncbi:hypothetical protein BDF19DRAFT_446639 [Syncephalis fuscata]|nr:hypothetical protein BDF19DRAFT_446639 [Syncephalis fuscata]